MGSDAHGKTRGRREHGDRLRRPSSKTAGEASDIILAPNSAPRTPAGRAPYTRRHRRPTARPARAPATPDGSGRHGSPRRTPDDRPRGGMGQPQRPSSGVLTTSEGYRSFHDGAQRHAVNSGHTSAVVGITDVVARERVDDRVVAPAAAPGVSILPYVLGVTGVRRHRVPCGTRDRPIYRRASQGEPRSDAIWSRLGASRAGSGRGREGIVIGRARAGAQAASVIVPSRCASYVVPSRRM